MRIYKNDINDIFIIFNCLIFSISILEKRLEVKAEKDLDDSQTHVADYANRTGL